jgi:hypothetical protein
MVETICQFDLRLLCRCRCVQYCAQKVFAFHDSTSLARVADPRLTNPSPNTLPDRVALISTAAGTEWLGDISDIAQYQSCWSRAVRCRDEGAVLDLPSEFSLCRVDPFFDGHPRGNTMYPGE